MHADQKAELNNNWKGGQMIHAKSGAIFKRSVGHPRATKNGLYVFEHILVMEKHLGRYLEKNEVVHHINGDKKDNRLENLQLMTHGEHSSIHRKIEREQGYKFGRQRSQAISKKGKYPCKSGGNNLA